MYKVEIGVQSNTWNIDFGTFGNGDLKPIWVGLKTEIASFHCNLAIAYQT